MNKIKVVITQSKDTITYCKNIEFTRSSAVLLKINLIEKTDIISEIAIINIGENDNNMQLLILVFNKNLESKKIQNIKNTELDSAKSV